MRRNLLLPGRVLLSMSLAGLLLLGGFLVAYGTLTERLSMYGVLSMVFGLSVLGGAAGAGVGGFLGMAGRPLDMGIIQAFKDQLLGGMYLLPGAMLGFVVSGWIGLTYLAFYSMNLWAITMTGAAWIAGALTMVTAVNYAITALANIGRRIMRLGKLRIRFEYGGEDE